jgi:hypothetical protein
MMIKYIALAAALHVGVAGAVVASWHVPRPAHPAWVEMTEIVVTAHRVPADPIPVCAEDPTIPSTSAACPSSASAKEWESWKRQGLHPCPEDPQISTADVNCPSRKGGHR